MRTQIEADQVAHQRVDRGKSQHDFHDHHSDDERNHREQQGLAQKLQAERQPARSEDLADADRARPAQRPRRSQVHIVDARHRKDEQRHGRAAVEIHGIAVGAVVADFGLQVSRGQRLQPAMPGFVERLARLGHVALVELLVDARPSPGIEIRRHQQVGVDVDPPKGLPAHGRVVGIPHERQVVRKQDVVLQVTVRRQIGEHDGDGVRNSRIRGDGLADRIGIPEVLAREGFTDGEAARLPQLRVRVAEDDPNGEDIEDVGADEIAVFPKVRVFAVMDRDAAAVVVALEADVGLDLRIVGREHRRECA